MEKENSRFYESGNNSNKDDISRTAPESTSVNNTAIDDTVEEIKVSRTDMPFFSKVHPEAAQSSFISVNELKKIKTDIAQSRGEDAFEEKIITKLTAKAVINFDLNLL